MGRVLIESLEYALDGRSISVPALTGARFLNAIAPRVTPKPKRRLLEAVCDEPGSRRSRRPSGKQFLNAITADPAD